MEQRRWLLFLAVSGVIYVVFIFFIWAPYNKRMKEYQEQQSALLAASQPTTDTVESATPLTSGTLPIDVSSTTSVAVPDTPTTPVVQREASQVVVKTDLYHVTLTTRGGRPTSWIYYDRIPNHDITEPIEIIPQYGDPESDTSREFPLEVAIREGFRLPYPQVNSLVYEVEVQPADDGSTEVIFTSPEIPPLQVVKRYRFRPNDYLTDLEVTVRNLGNATVRVADRIGDTDVGVGISWGPGIRELNDQRLTTRDRYMINTVAGTPNGASYSAPSIKDKNIKESAGDILWAGLTDKYFLAAVIPDRAEGTTGTAVRRLVRRRNSDYETKSHKPFTIEVYSGSFDLRPRHQMNLDYSVFVGPKRPNLLREMSKRTGGSRLTGVLFYRSWFGWSRALKIGLMHSLNWLYRVVGNYGLAIVILTFLIRILMHPIAHKGMKIQAKTMEEMGKIKPELDAINKKYKSDPTKRNQEMMALYKTHGISPLAPLRGCLPMLVQLPIFFALYQLLSESIDLRGATFLWIDDLSGPDTLIDLTKHGWDFTLPLLGAVTAFNLLPFLMGASQYAMSKMTPTPGSDQSQKQMMLIFSLIFPFLLYNFPSGLFIYWLINNVWQSVHQLIAKRIVKKPTEDAAASAKA